jgi:dTDP-4-dehydrorhamnose reductase
MARLLITGASGLLGANLARLAADEHQVVAASLRTRLRLPGVQPILADLTEPGLARRLLRELRPDWVVHCAAATDLERCERKPDWAHALNVGAARGVAEGCAETGARLMHISTDSVFDGRGGPYREQDQPQPVNLYARTKLEGEQAVREACPGALILRTNFVGWSLLPGRSLAEWFLDRLERSLPTPGFSDVYFSPLVVDHLAGLILELLAAPAQGLLHLPGAACLSKFDFGVRLAQAFGLDSALVQPASLRDSGLAAPRPLRTCLDGRRAAELLARPLPELEDGLQLLRRTRAAVEAVRAAQAHVEELAHESD